MNIKKGFFRITLVSSILSGLIVLLICSQDIPRPDTLFQILPILLAFLFGFIPVWLIYFFIKYIIVGFIMKVFKGKE